jgi:hypothetical protein
MTNFRSPIRFAALLAASLMCGVMALGAVGCAAPATSTTSTAGAPMGVNTQIGIAISAVSGVQNTVASFLGAGKISKAEAIKVQAQCVQLAATLQALQAAGGFSLADGTTLQNTLLAVSLLSNQYPPKGTP